MDYRQQATDKLRNARRVLAFACELFVRDPHEDMTALTRTEYNQVMQLLADVEEHLTGVKPDVGIQPEEDWPAATGEWLGDREKTNA